MLNEYISPEIVSVARSIFGAVFNFLKASVAPISFLLGLMGVLLTFVTFFAPRLIQKIALKSAGSWREVPEIKPETKLYRHSVLSGFMIEVSPSEERRGEDFFEHWMGALQRPDLSTAVYDVTILFNGYPVDRFLFLNYDGGRNFIPIPEFRSDKGKRYVFFTSDQCQLAQIVGSDYFNRPFNEVSQIITNSRFNPESLKPVDVSSSEPLEDLQKWIDKLRTRQERIGKFRM